MEVLRLDEHIRVEQVGHHVTPRCRASSSKVDCFRVCERGPIAVVYPEGAWYSYDDETCDYDCMGSEYIYWSLTSILGAQDYPGRLDQIGREWRLNTRELVMEKDPDVYAIMTNPEYNLPSVLPDGKYAAREFVIETY